MHPWPIDIPFASGTSLKLQAFGEDLLFERINASRLTYTFGKPESKRLVAVADKATIIRFLPTLGERALLFFPETKFLCPAGLELRTIFPLPVHLHIGVGTPTDVRLIEDLAPPTTTRALYGPVDSGIICTSVRARTAPSITDYLNSHTDEGTKVPEFHFGSKLPNDDPSVAEPSDATNAGTTNASNKIRFNQLIAYATITIINTTNEPLEVSKIMIPYNALSLYQTNSYLLCNEIQMRLLSRLEAEITPGDCPDPKAKPVDQGQGRFAVVDRRPHIFAYAYRSKTGLDYGF